MKRRYLSDFNSPTPRAVPLSVRLRVLFGGFNNQFGWAFFGFGMIFVWLFALNADFISPFLFSFQSNKVGGIVESVETTNATENDVQVYRVNYVYFDHLGRQHTGSSYSTGDPGAGGRVFIEYLPYAPSISRIEGMRRAIFGPFAVTAIIIPLIGLGFLVAGVRNGLKANRLLAQGRIAFGKLIASEMTNISINNRPVMKLRFAFTSHEGLDWEVVAKTHEPEDLIDEQEEPLLYDPEYPAYAVLLDNLPGSTMFDSSGHLLPGSMWETVGPLILPGLTVFGHGLYLIIAAFR